MTKTKNRFGISNFGHCDLFDIRDLLFGIFSHSRTEGNLEAGFNPYFFFSNATTLGKFRK
jgi:hypothetical protein